MIIYYWKYYLSYGILQEYELNCIRETKKTYFCTGDCRFLKQQEAKCQIKDRTSYPYIDVYFTESKTRAEVVDCIITYLKDFWGLL